jgi:rhodanese-related sulfurtransferase
MNASRRRIEQLKAAIQEVDPKQAFAHSQNGSTLIDVRENDEMSQGVASTASRLGRGFLELKVEQLVPDLGKPVILMCASGVRSLFAAESLRQLGYEDVSSVRGGFNAWKRQGLPVHSPRLLTDDERERYGRHLTIPEVGEEGQVKLLQSKVLMIGAGGLGSPAAYYLAAAGVGTLGIVDDDVVDRSNLQRQILHTEERVGSPKVQSARKTLESIKSSIHIDDHMTRLD